MAFQAYQNGVWQEDQAGVSHELSTSDLLLSGTNQSDSNNLLLKVEELEELAHAQQGMAADLDDLEASLGINTSHKQGSKVSICTPNESYGSREFTNSPGSLKKANSHPLPGLDSDGDTEDDDEVDSAALRGKPYAPKGHVVFSSHDASSSKHFSAGVRDSTHSAGSLHAELSLSPGGAHRLASSTQGSDARRGTHASSLGLDSPPESPHRWGQKGNRASELDNQGTSSGVGRHQTRSSPQPSASYPASGRSGQGTSRSPWRGQSRASKADDDAPRASPQRGMHDPLTPEEEALNTMYYREVRAKRRLQERQAAFRTMLADEELAACSFRPNISPASQRIISVRRSMSPSCSAPCSLAHSQANISSVSLPTAVASSNITSQQPDGEGRARSSPRSRPLAASDSQWSPMPSDPSKAILFSNEPAHDRLHQHAHLLQQRKEEARQTEAEREQQARNAFRARSPGGKGPQPQARYRDLPPPKQISSKPSSKSSGLYIGTFQQASRPLQPATSQQTAQLHPSHSFASHRTAATISPQHPPWAQPFNRFQDVDGSGLRTVDSHAEYPAALTSKAALKLPAKSMPMPLPMGYSVPVPASQFQKTNSVHPGVLSAALAQRNESFVISHQDSSKVGISNKSFAGSHASRISYVQSFPIPVVPAAAGLPGPSPTGGTKPGPGFETIAESGSEQHSLSRELSAAFLERQQHLLLKQQMKQEQAWADIRALQSTRSLSPGTQRILDKKLQEGDVYVPPHKRPLSPGTQHPPIHTDYLRGSSPWRLGSRSPGRSVSPAYSTGSRPSSEGPRAHRLHNVDVILRSRSSSGYGGPTFTFKPQITQLAAAMAPSTIEQLVDGGRGARDAWLDALRMEKEMVEAQQRWGELAYVARPSPTALGKPYLSLRRPSEYLAVMTARKAAAEAQAKKAREEREAKELAECSFKPKTTPLPLYITRQHGLPAQSPVARTSRQPGSKSVGGESPAASVTYSPGGSYSAMRQQHRQGADSSLHASYSLGGFSEPSAFLTSLVAEGESEAQLFEEHSRGSSPAPPAPAHSVSAPPTPAQPDAAAQPALVAQSSQASLQGRTGVRGMQQVPPAVGSLQQLAQELALEQSSISTHSSRLGVASGVGSRIPAAPGQAAPARAVLMHNPMYQPQQADPASAKPQAKRMPAESLQAEAADQASGFIPAAWWQPASHALQEAQEAEQAALMEVFGADVAGTAAVGPASGTGSFTGPLDWPKPGSVTLSGGGGGGATLGDVSPRVGSASRPGPTQDLAQYKQYLAQLRNNL